MKNKKIPLQNIIKTLKKKNCEILSNISYKDNFHPKDTIRIKHKCGKERTIRIKEYKNYNCTCLPNKGGSNITIKICVLCEKPHYARSQLCTMCHNKKNSTNMSIRKLVYFKKLYNVQDVFLLMEKKPELFNVKIDYKESLVIKGQERAKFRDPSYFKENYQKWESDIPQYIKDLFKRKQQYELLTLSGNKINPNIHYTCKKCNDEFSQKYKDIQSGKGHGCISSKSSGEVIVEEFVKNCGYKIYTQFDTLKCINPITKRQLPYDIELVNEKIIIEINGPQHYEFIEHFHGTIENFNYQCRKDDYKRRFAEKKGYKVVEVDYSHLSSGEYKKIILTGLNKIPSYNSEFTDIILCHKELR